MVIIYRACREKHLVKTPLQFGGGRWGRLGRLREEVFLPMRCFQAKICFLFLIWSVSLLCAAGPKAKPVSTTTGKSPTSGPTTEPVLSSSGMADHLSQLYKTGKYKELLKKTVVINFDKQNLEFQWKALLLQSEAYRRLGSYIGAEKSLWQLQKYLLKEPGRGRLRTMIFRGGDYVKVEGYWERGASGSGTYRHRPDEKRNYVSFLISIYKSTKGGVYRSPLTGKSLGSKPVSNNSAWEVAKTDTAKCRLKEIDAILKGIAGVKTPKDLFSRFIDSLRIIDDVRLHRPKQADAKAAPVIIAFIKRYEQLAEEPCKKSMERAEKLRKGKIWPKRQFLTAKKRKSIVKNIWKTSKQTYVDNYRWGALTTGYSRRYGFLKKTQPEINKIAARRKKLEASFVKLDEYVQHRWRTHSLSKPGKPALSKIPTKPW